MLFNAYKTLPITIDRGNGVYLIDVNGKKYLDFSAGIAVNSLGHCHPEINDALTKQLNKIWHCHSIPNEERTKFARNLVKKTPSADMVLFCSSGAEAIECAIKTARKYQWDKGLKSKNTIISLSEGFHGRTMATISLNDSQSAREGFGPLLQEFKIIKRNDIEEVEREINAEAAAIIIEPIQAEGGINILDIEYLKKIRELTTEHGVVLVFDEIQCGYGRTGELFYHQQIGIDPDVITCAKGMGNGFPIGACLAKRHVAESITPGTHGSTYGGNPMGMAVGSKVLEIISDKEFLENVKNTGKYLGDKLKELQNKFPNIISDVRGIGLIWGMDILIPDGINIKEKVMENGMIITTTMRKKNVMRFTPPLIIKENHVDEAIKILDKTFSEL